jgi:hypothetical protein
VRAIIAFYDALYGVDSVASIGRQGHITKLLDAKQIAGLDKRLTQRIGWRLRLSQYSATGGE